MCRAIIRYCWPWMATLAVGCGVTPTDRSGQLFAEAATLLDRNAPYLCARVLGSLSLIDDPRSRRLALRFCDDPNPELQHQAWSVLTRVAGPDRVATIERAMAHRDYRVRTLGAIAAGDATLTDPRLDAALERTLASEQIGSLLTRAAKSLCRRDPRTGAHRAFAILAARGPQWVGCALEVCAAHPESDFAEVFRGALDGDLDQRILGARGLLALDSLAPDDPLRATAARRTYGEFDDQTMAIDVDHGEMREGTWRELVHDVSEAQVAVIGESHCSVAEGAVQCGLIDGLVRLWGDAAGALLHERPMQDCQRLPATAARMAGMEVRLVEAEAAEAKTTFERDGEAWSNIVQIARANPDRHFVVVYGNGHRESFVRHLRANDIAVAAVSTCGTSDMWAGALRCAGTLQVCGRVFRCADGTWFMAADSIIEDLVDASAPAR